VKVKGIDEVLVPKQKAMKAYGKVEVYSSTQFLNLGISWR